MEDLTPRLYAFAILLGTPARKAWTAEESLLVMIGGRLLEMTSQILSTATASCLIPCALSYFDEWTVSLKLASPSRVKSVNCTHQV